MQTTKSKGIDRTQHVWHYRKDDEDWKCVICGGICRNPVDLERRDSDSPDKFEKLTDAERAMCPLRLKTVGGGTC